MGTYFGSDPIKRTDVNRNGIVYYEDMGCLAAAWLTKAGDVGFNPYVDFNCDGIINIFDAGRIAKDWLKVYEV